MKNQRKKKDAIKSEKNVIISIVVQWWMCPNSECVNQTPATFVRLHSMQNTMSAHSMRVFLLFQNWWINNKSNNSISTSVSSMFVDESHLRKLFDAYTFVRLIHLIYLGQHSNLLLLGRVVLWSFQNVLIAIIPRMTFSLSEERSIRLIHEKKMNWKSIKCVKAFRIATFDFAIIDYCYWIQTVICMQCADAKNVFNICDGFFLCDVNGICLETNIHDEIWTKPHPAMPNAWFERIQCMELTSRFRSNGHWIFIFWYQPVYWI